MYVEQILKIDMLSYEMFECNCNNDTYVYGMDNIIEVGNYKWRSMLIESRQMLEQLPQFSSSTDSTRVGRIHFKYRISKSKNNHKLGPIYRIEFGDEEFSFHLKIK